MVSLFAGFFSLSPRVDSDADRFDSWATHHLAQKKEKGTRAVLECLSDNFFACSRWQLLLLERGALRLAGAVRPQL